MTLTTATIACPSCGGENASDSRFCRHCGASLATPPAQEIPEVAPVAATPVVEAPVVAAPVMATEVIAAPEIETPPTEKTPVEAPVVEPIAEAAPVGAEPAVATSTAEAVAEPAPTATPLETATASPVVPPATSTESDLGFEASLIPSIIEDRIDGEEEVRSSPAEIDGRRARQLLERALHLSERGDTPGAILASRQAIALAPDSVAGHSMLGLLLEKSGDLTHAALAYEKAVQLAPNSAVEKESLDRLRQRLQGQTVSNAFKFDDDDLFSPRESPEENKAAPLVPNSAGAASLAAAATPILAESGWDEATPLPRISAAAPGLPADFAQKAVAVPERRAQDRRAAKVPIPVDRRVAPDRRTAPVRPASLPTLPLPPTGIKPAAVPIKFEGVSETPNSTWGALWKRPSFYGRSLPLLAATVLALGFLAWARSWAVARSAVDDSTTPTTLTSNGPVDPVQNTSAPTTNVVPQNNTGVAPPPLGSTASSSANGGIPISNRPAGGTTTASTQNAGATTTTNRPVTTGGTAGGTRVAAGPVRHQNPQFPDSIPPAAIVTRAPSSGSSLGLPAPEINSAPPAPAPISVQPPRSDATALDPSGSSGRNYIRITRGGIGVSQAPQRSNSQASASERAAANASRNNQPDQAISNLSSAINSDTGDNGYRYQQRATLFLDRGDYSRAINDFQSAISSYNDQISRGENVSAARAGLRSARSGLTLAQAQAR